MKSSKDLCHELANALSISSGLSRSYLTSRKASLEAKALGEESAQPKDPLEKIEKALAALERAEKLVHQLRATLRQQSGPSDTLK